MRGFASSGRNGWKELSVSFLCYGHRQFITIAVVHTYLPFFTMALVVIPQANPFVISTTLCHKPLLKITWDFVMQGRECGGRTARRAAGQRSKHGLKRRGRNRSDKCVPILRGNKLPHRQRRISLRGPSREVSSEGNDGGFL